MRSRRRSITFAAMLGITGVVLAAATPDAPDSRINALSGSIETVEAGGEPKHQPTRGNLRDVEETLH